ncbi:MAG: hypothetical protein ACKVS9_19325 [Phycisphaerae bacterium]
MSIRVLRGLGCALTVSAAPIASAGSMTVVVGDSYGSSTGGEFNLTPSGLPFTPVSYSGGASFESFCIERSEHISIGGTYHVDVTTEARNGGNGGGSPDPLDPLTAYLYSQFVKGSLVDYAYDVSGGAAAREASANALQDVIWYIEQEQGATWTLGDNSLRDRFYQDAVANSNGSINDVRVLNLYADAGHTDFHQDQLVRIPEPATVWLMVGALALLRRR